MGIFNKMNDWVNKTSSRIIAGGGEQAAQAPAYGAENQGMNYAAEEPQQAAPQQPAFDPFKRDGDGEYGGRQVYRSRVDAEQEEMQKQQAEMLRRQQMAQQQPMQQMPPQQMQQMPPQQQMQPQQGYQQNPAASNVVPFPGMRQGADGMVYGHVEYILFLHGCGQCRRVIDFIKTNASVFLNMEFIANEAERQRCVDFLSGAVYALGCTLNKISTRGIYLISAPSVKVILDATAQKMGKAPETRGFVQQRYDQPARQPAQQMQPQREQMTQQFQPVQPQAAQQAAPQYAQQEQQMANAGSFTQRFAAQGTQRNRPVTFATAMGGNNAGHREARYPQ